MTPRDDTGLNRRDFLKIGGTAVAAGGMDFIARNRRRTNPKLGIVAV